MSLQSWYLRRRINGAREGKEGAVAMNVLKALDGYKRIIVLLAYIVVVLMKASGHGDYEGYLGPVFKLLDWNADGVLPVPIDVIAGTAAGAVAIGHAIAKEIRDKRSAANTVSLPK